MPKRRSNTISTESNSGTGAIGASGSGMSPGVINDLASRVNNRLSESRGSVRKMRISHVKSIFPADTNGLQTFYKLFLYSFNNL